MYASYLVELSMLDYGMLKFAYSMLAAAAVYAANLALNRMPEYPRSLERHSTFSEEDVTPCATAMATLFMKAPHGRPGPCLSFAAGACAAKFLDALRRCPADWWWNGDHRLPKLRA
jgi:hypothetical protein